MASVMQVALTLRVRSEFGSTWGVTNRRRQEMANPNRKYVLMVLAPALFIPLTLALARQEQSNVLLGLSSDFWAGTMIGVTVAVATLGISLLVRSRQM